MTCVYSRSSSDKEPSANTSTSTQPKTLWPRNQIASRMSKLLLFLCVLSQPTRVWNGSHPLRMFREESSSEVLQVEQEAGSSRVSFAVKLRPLRRVDISEVAKTVFDCHVTAICSKKNIDYVRSLGADLVIDYTTHDVPQTLVRNMQGTKYDLIVDCVGGTELLSIYVSS